MAKTKKMAFGGPSFGGPKPPGMTAPKPGMGIPNYAQSASQQGGPKQLPAPPGAIFPQQMQTRMQQMAQQSRGALGGNQLPAGANGLQAYARNTLRPGNGLQSLDPNVDKAMQSYQAQAGQATTPPAFKSIAGIAGAMKKGGAVKTKKYARGGDVQSESSKLDQKNEKLDKAQEEGRKRYEKQEIEDNQAPRKAASEAVGKAFDYVKKGLGMKKGGSVSSASRRGDGIATKGKTKGRII